MLDIDYFGDGADKFGDGTDKNAAFQELLNPAAYKSYLQTMTHFHNYSIRNILLIYKQMPHATRLAGYGAWPKQKRNVKKGGKSIKILSPKPSKSTGVLAPKINPETGSPLLDGDGKKVLEELTHASVEFEEATVFDVSQTHGKPIQKLNDNPTADEAMKMAFIDALKAIVAQSGTHDEPPELTQDEITALINDIIKAETAKVKLSTFPQVGERLVRDSIVFVLHRRFGLDVGGFSFDFISELREEILPLFASCLDTVKTEASSLITAIEGKFVQTCEEKGLNPMVDYEPNTAPFATPSIQTSKVKNSEGEYRILDAVKKAVLHYGRKRVAWVLAVAVKNAESNTFSKDNEHWAIQHLKVTGYPKEPAAFSFKTAPALLEAFINRFREIESDPKPFYEERLKSAEKRMKLQANNKPQ